MKFKNVEVEEEGYLNMKYGNFYYQSTKAYV